MNLLSQLFAPRSTTSAPPSFSSAEAFAAVIVAAVASDGYLAPEEADALLSSLSRMHLFREYADEELRKLLSTLCQQLQQNGVGCLFEVAKNSIPPELHATAFAVATDLILSDGLMSGEEQDFLNDLYQVLDLPDDMANRILDVMMIKNRG
jgi:tellurite resistance protein